MASDQGVFFGVDMGNTTEGESMNSIITPEAFAADMLATIRRIAHEENVPELAIALVAGSMMGRQFTRETWSGPLPRSANRLNDSILPTCRLNPHVCWKAEGSIPSAEPAQPMYY